ncbi:MAG: hypothetical protein ACOX88_06135 [Christensenellales bacterium]
MVSLLSLLISAVGVGEGVTVGVAVGVGEGVTVGVGEGVAVGDGEGVIVGVGEGMGVGVGSAVGVDEGVEGVGSPIFCRRYRKIDPIIKPIRTIALIATMMVLFIVHHLLHMPVFSSVSLYL